MKIYGHPGSTCTRKVLTVLLEKQATFDFEIVDLAKREQKAPANLKRHPFAVVPTLEDAGFWLYESRAIIRYLDRRLPGEALTPTDAHGFARMEQFISVEQSYFSGPAMVLVGELLMAPQRGNTTDMTKVENATPKLKAAMEVLDRHLNQNPFFAGERFSLADISFMPYVEMLKQTNLGQRMLSERVSLSGWWDRVSARPSWQAVRDNKAVLLKSV